MALIACTHGCWPQVAASDPSEPRLAVNCLPHTLQARDRGFLPASRAALVPPALWLQRRPQVRHGELWLKPR